MASPFAVVTLVSSDSYLPGALAQVAALRDLHPSPAELPEVDFQTVCIVTPESLDVATIKRLRKAFDLVVGVEILEQENAQGLKLLGKSFERVQFISAAPSTRIYAPLSAPYGYWTRSPVFLLISGLKLTFCASRPSRPHHCPYKIAYIPSNTVQEDNFSRCRRPSNSFYFSSLQHSPRIFCRPRCWLARYFQLWCSSLHSWQREIRAAP